MSSKQDIHGKNNASKLPNKMGKIPGDCSGNKAGTSESKYGIIGNNVTLQEKPEV